SPGDAQCAALAAAGYGLPVTLLESLARVRQSARYLQLPALSRQRFDALLPQLLRVAAATATSSTVQPEAVFGRLLTLLETISGRSVYLALLFEHPPVLPRLAQLMAASAWAADYLTRHPLLLDELLDSRVLLAEPDWDAWRIELDLQLRAHSGDPERQMDALRHFQHAQTFRLLAQDLHGRLTVERLADHLSALADIVLAATLEHCWVQMHGEAKLAPPKFAIIGAAFEAEREVILRSAREPFRLRDDVVEMRRRMYAGHPNRSALFDLKHDPGGMVDVEFTVQFLVLLHSARHSSLTRNVGNIALLALASELGLVPAPLAASVAAAYREYRRLQHQIRLQGALL